MPLITPITDRTQADVDYARAHPDSPTVNKGALNHQDLNRIESNCEYLASQLNHYGYNVKYIPHHVPAVTREIQNLVINGSFENGTTGWVIQSATQQIVDGGILGTKCLRLSGTTEVEVLCNTQAIIPYDKTHYYYSSYWVKAPSTIRNTQIYFPLAAPFYSSHDTGHNDTWRRYSLITPPLPTAANGNVPARLDMDNVGVAMSALYDGVLVVDLTGAFGAGGEPSKEWCDNNITYFEGTVQLVIIPEHSEWIMSDFPYRSEIDRIRNNINALLTAYHKLQGSPDIRYWDSLDWNDANSLEQNILNMDIMLQRMAAFFKYSGMDYSGEW